MGLGGSTLTYEGYGKTRREAALALGHMLRYHHGNVTVHKGTASAPQGPAVVYFAFDGKEHPIYFTQSNDRVKAFLRE